MPSVDSEEIERTWFVRFAAVLMVVTICVGALPLIKTALFPVERTNR